MILWFGLYDLEGRDIFDKLISLVWDHLKPSDTTSNIPIRLNLTPVIITSVEDIKSRPKQSSWSTHQDWHTLKLQETRSNYTTHAQTTRYSVKHSTLVKATVLVDKIKTDIPLPVSLVQGFFDKSKLSRFQGTRYIVKPSRSVKADASGR